jgi:hypothetical protein
MINIFVCVPHPQTGMSRTRKWSGSIQSCPHPGMAVFAGAGGGGRGGRPRPYCTRRHAEVGGGVSTGTGFSLRLSSWLPVRLKALLARGAGGQRPPMTSTPTTRRPKRFSLAAPCLARAVHSAGAAVPVGAGRLARDAAPAPGRVARAAPAAERRVRLVPGATLVPEARRHRNGIPAEAEDGVRGRSRRAVGRRRGGHLITRR